MAESTASLSLTHFRKEVIYYIGWGTSYVALAAGPQDRVDSIIRDGVTEFYATPGHQWSFLRPVGTLTTNSPYSTGTLGIVSGVVTLTSGTWPSWAASGVLSVASATYSISTRDSGTQLTLTDLSVNVSSGTAYQLTQQDYNAPDDFGSLDGDMTFASSDGVFPSVKQRGEGDIRALRQGNIFTGIPQIVGVQPQGSTTATTGQRWKFLLWPTPAAAYTLAYPYWANQNLLSDSLPYPLGGMQHGETILASILKKAEERVFGISGGEKAMAYETRLAASVKRDRECSPSNMGNYLNPRVQWMTPIIPSTQPYTINGVPYS